MQTVQTVLAASTALVTWDTLEMESIAVSSSLTVCTVHFYCNFKPVCVLMQLASMELSSYGMAAMLVREGWKSATATLMELCAMTFGMTLMLKLSAGDLVF